MNTFSQAGPAAPTGRRLQIPSELGSRAAKSSIRLIELEQRLAHLPELEASLLKAQAWANDLAAYVARLEAHARHLEATIQEQHSVIQHQQAKITSLGRRAFARRAVRLLIKVVTKARPAAALKQRTQATDPPSPGAVGGSVLDATTALAAPTAPSCGAVGEESSPPMVLSQDARYADWIRKHEPGIADLRPQSTARSTSALCLSILAPGQASSDAFLRAMIDSVLQQTYTAWELWLAQAPSDEGLLTRLGVHDDRIKTVAIEAASNVVEAGNCLLAAATGAFVTLLDPNDTLAPFALHEIAQALDRHPGADFLYSDEDCLDEGGLRATPAFKPEWSPDTLRSHNYIGRPYVLSRTLLERVGGFRSGFAGHEDYDLVLRATEQASCITHIPKVLYHRRMTRDRVQSSVETSQEGAQQALREHVQRLGCAAEVTLGLQPDTYEIRHALASRPLVSILIASKDNVEMLSYCVDSIRRSSYAHHEIIIMENGSERPETFAYYEKICNQPNTHVHVWEKPFNYSAINNEAVRQARGEMLLFLNNDIQVINDDWIERMLEHALRPRVGAVGAKLYFPDDTIQHAGTLVGATHGPQHILAFAERGSAGYANRLVVTQNLSAVTAACLMMRRQVFDEVGGLDEGFAVAFNDVDLCLKARQKGYQVVWTPYAELYHFESVTRGYNVDATKRAFENREHDKFFAKWRTHLPEVDPYYNPNLEVYPPDCSLRS